MSRQISISDEALKKLDIVRFPQESYSRVISRILPGAQYAGPPVIHAAMEELRWIIARHASTDWIPLLNELERVLVRDGSKKNYSPIQRTIMISKISIAIKEGLSQISEYDPEVNDDPKIQAADLENK